MEAALKDFQVKHLPELRLIGKGIKVNMDSVQGNPIPGFWSECFCNGTILKLEGHPERVHKNALIGWCGDFDEENKTFVYIVGVLCRKEAKVPDCLGYIDFPDSSYAVGTISGKEPDVFMQAFDLTKLEIAKKGYRKNPKITFDFEWYDERFCDEAEVKVIDYYIPIL